MLQPSARPLLRSLFLSKLHCSLTKVRRGRGLLALPRKEEKRFVVFLVDVEQVSSCLNALI